MRQFLVWDDALEYYAESFYMGHVHCTNSLTDKTVRSFVMRNRQPGTGVQGFGPNQPGPAANPIVVPSATVTLTAIQVVPSTPTRAAPGTEVNPIFVPSTMSTPHVRTQPGGVGAHSAHRLARPDPNSAPGRRLLAIETASDTAKDQKGKKPRFVVTNDSDSDENTIKGYFTVQRNATAGSSCSG